MSNLTYYFCIKTDFQMRSDLKFALQRVQFFTKKYILHHWVIHKRWGFNWFRYNSQPSFQFSISDFYYLCPLYDFVTILLKPCDFLIYFLQLMESIFLLVTFQGQSLVKDKNCRPPVWNGCLAFSFSSRSFSGIF